MAEPAVPIDDSRPRTETHPAPNLPQSDTQPGVNNTLIVHSQQNQESWVKRWRGAFFTAGFALLLSPLAYLFYGEAPIDQANYAERTKRVLSQVPLIDGHNDFPWLLRVELHNKIYDGTFDPNQRLLGHTDIARMRAGQMGGQFWSVYVHCDAQQQHFEDPSWIVRDTLEQIDIARRFIAEYPDVFQFCDTSACARAAHAEGKIASMLGIEGGHQLGGSIASVRQAYNLGARYITTTHNCDNAWATSTSTVAAGGEDLGLTGFGKHYVREMYVYPTFYL